jgi:hypothetical protein
MGFSVKAAVKAVQKAAAPVTQAIKDTANVSKDLTKGGLSGGLQTLGSLAKGDVKGAAGGLLKLGEVGTKGILDSVKASGNLSTGLLSNVGSAVGSKDITKTAENIKREGGKGVDQYGGMAVDIGANALTGGTYGAAKTALQGLQEGGLKSVVNPKNLKDLAVDFAASKVGVDPDALKAAQAAAKGDLKGAALQAMGSPAINKQSLDMAKAALKGGDLKDILKSPEMKSALASGVGAVAGAYGAKVDPELLKAGVGVSLGESAKGEAAKFGAAKAGLGETQADLAANLAKGQSLKEAGMDYGLRESGLDQRIQQAKDIRSQAQGMRDQARDIRSQAQDLRSQALGMPQQLTESAMGEMDMAKQDLQNRAMGATMEAVSPMMSSAKSQMDQFKPSKRGRRMKALLKRGSYRIG